MTPDTTPETPELAHQTLFAAEEPLLESPQAPSVPQAATPVAPASRTKLYAFIGGATLLVLMITLLVVFRPAPAAPEATPLPTIGAFNPSRPEHPLQQRIDRLESQLKEADPARQDIVFPTVEFALELDPKPLE